MFEDNTIVMMQILNSTYQWLNEKGFFHLLFVNFLANILGFISSLTVAKLLSPTELGQTRIFQTYLNLLLLICGFGLNTSVLKFCAERLSEEKRNYILKYATGRSLIVTAVVFVVAFILTKLGIIVSSGKFSTWFIILMLSMPFSIVTQMLLTYKQALKEMKTLAKLQLIIRGESFVLVILLTWKWGFKGFVISLVVANVAGLIPALIDTTTKPFYTLAEKLPSNFWSVSIYSMMANGVNMLGHYVDVIMLDHFNPDRESIGYYSLALIFLNACIQVNGTVQSIITPYISEKSDDKVWVHKQIVMNQLRMSALSIFIAAGTYLAASVCIHYLFGPEYRIALTFLAVLLIKYIIMSSYSVIGAAFVGLGLMSYNFLVVSISTPVGFVLSYLMLKKWGVVGVAWAQVFSSSLILILLLVLYPFAMRKTFADRENID